MVAEFDVTYDSLGIDDAPALESIISNLRFRADDTNTQDLNFPLIIPATASTIFSFWKQIYLKASAAPSLQVDNVKLFTDATLDWGLGVVVQVGDGVQVKNSVVSTGYDVADAQEIMTNHSDVSTETLLFSFDSGSPRTITISETSNIIDAINETTDYVVLQTDVDETATPGTKPQETITWQYDEI